MEKYLYEDLYKLEDSHWWHIAKRRPVLEILQGIKSQTKLKILDVGCGTGKNMEMFSKIGEVWGIDNSKDAINFCKKRGLKNLKLATLESNGFEDNQFDIVTMLDVLEHIEDDFAAIIEVKRILKKGGNIILTVPAYGWLWSKWDEVLHHKRRYTRQSLVSVFDRAGFKVKKVSYMYSFLVLPVLISRSLKSLFFPNDYGSDFKLNSGMINKLFDFLSQLEFKLSNIFTIPFGTSIVCMANT